VAVIWERGLGGTGSVTGVFEAEKVFHPEVAEKCAVVDEGCDSMNFGSRAGLGVAVGFPVKDPEFLGAQGIDEVGGVGGDEDLLVSGGGAELFGEVGEELGVEIVFWFIDEDELVWAGDLEEGCCFGLGCGGGGDLGWAGFGCW
jgi:hypothetical protein